jgi:hypothetical protein
MKIALITNIDNGIGLHTEYVLLRKYLESLGHEVSGVQFDQDAPNLIGVDLAISLETVCRHLLQLAPVNWLFVNPEWTKRHDLDLIERSYEKIFCKTHEAHRIFSDLYPDRTHYVGFLVRDQFDPSVPREPLFLHVGGNSSFRGTQAVLDAWRWKRNGKTLVDRGAKLTIVSTALTERPPVPGVTFLNRIPEESLRILQNGFLFHLYPSGTEGFGHALREGLSVNASVLTTDAPPMNELTSVSRIPSTGWEQYNLARVHEVSALDIYAGVESMLEMYREGHRETGAPREEFLRGNEQFKAAFAEHLEKFVPPNSKNEAVTVQTNRKSFGTRRIAFMGNFAASESTENMIKWALETGLGHKVDCLQENEISDVRDLEHAARNADLFLWVRTPGWLRIEDERMTKWLQQTFTPTVSLHLDRFWGIPEREALIGKHPFWKTDVVYTADGGNQDNFISRGVNHRWLIPAVSEVYVHPGTPQEKYRCDVGFVGAKEYHKEYPFRAQMVEFLEETYGPRFKHVTGVRGHELNDVYASMKVCVGDCFSAGSPYYWSDRLPECTGRHGFLVHPNAMGIENPVVCYAPQNLDSLKEIIDRFIDDDNGRREIIGQCVDYVRKHDTWTIRMGEILKEVLG